MTTRRSSDLGCSHESSDDSDDSDSSDDSHYIHKRLRSKKHRKKDPIRACATLTANLLTTAFKSKMIRFKLDEDPLQRRIYFLTFIDSLNMVFSQYRETYEVLRDYPKLERVKFKIMQKWPLGTYCMPIVVFTVEDLLHSSQKMKSNVFKNCIHIVQI